MGLSRAPESRELASGGLMSGGLASDGPASRWLALTVLCAAMMMIILDGTIVTVALPEIQRDLGFSSSGLAWVVNAYLIAFGGLLLLAGRLGDLIGGKRVFLAGLAVFVVASLLCGVSVSQPMLIAARFAQGAGGAMASAVSLGMIVRLFPEPPLRARALGIYSCTGAGGASVGLVLGGVLTQALSWHWIFFVNIPIGAVAIAAGGLLLAGERGTGLRHGADAVGALLVTAGLMTAVYAIVETSGYGWGSARTLAPAPSRWCCWPRSSPASTWPAPRSSRCGYSGPVMSPGRTSCRRSRWPRRSASRC